MSDREKLIELLKESVRKCASAKTCRSCCYRPKADCVENATADRLIANGVTVATDKNVGDKWIPVSERLPSFEDAIQPTAYDDPAVLAVFKFDDRPRIWCIDVIRRNPEKFTHWMPIPEPPKDGIS